MNNTPKYSVSSTLGTLEWANSSLVTGDLAEVVAELKEQPGKNVQIPGSPRLGRSLPRDGLLDELSLMKIIRVHHLTLAVRDAEVARATFESLFGVAGLSVAAVPAFGVRTTGVPIGEDLLQLVSPMSMDNPVMRFLERKGEGFYNVALEVDDLDAAVRELSAKGVRVSEPVQAERGLRSAFVTMAATHGLSVQLVEVIAGDVPEPMQPGEPAAVPEPPPPDASAPSPNTDADSPEPLDLTPDEWSDVD